MEESTFGLKIGDVIQDTYRITKVLGEGGMGVTFAGQNVATGHDVAIKVMTESFARNKKAVELFRRESSLLRTVQNPAVVRYETTLQDKAGRMYLVMEYIAGKPLKHYLKQGARLKTSDVLKLGQRLGSGLAAIHALGIVHRDVAPDNILVPDEDILGAKFIDFGLASDTYGTDKSIIGDSFAGKFDFCAPEQLGLFGGEVSFATDVFSLGLVLLKTATGKKVPGEGDGVAALDARRQDVDISGYKLDPVLRKVLSAMLRADPNKRPKDLMGLLHKALTAQASQGQGKGAADTAKTDFVEAVAADNKSGGLKGGLIFAGVAALGAVAVGGYLAFVGVGERDLTGSGSLDQAAAAKEVLKAADPLDAATQLIQQGGTDNLNSALGVLIAISADKENADKTRGAANLMIAQMHDPETFSPSTSPFPKANIDTALRYYKKAAQFGSADAKPVLKKLGE